MLAALGLPLEHEFRLRVVRRRRVGALAGQFNVRHGLQPAHGQPDVADAVDPVARRPLLGRADGPNVGPGRHALGPDDERAGVIFQNLRPDLAVGVDDARQDALAHDAAVLGPDRELLPDVAALAEVDAAHEVDVGVERQRLVRHHLPGALGHAAQEPPHRVRLARARLRVHLQSLPLAARDDAPAEVRRPRVARDVCAGSDPGQVLREDITAVGGRERLVPVRVHKRLVGLDLAVDQLAPQLVAAHEGEEGVDLAARDLDEERAARRQAPGLGLAQAVVLRVRVHKGVVQDAALRRQERRVEAVGPWCIWWGRRLLVHRGRHQALQELGRVDARDGDQAAVRERRVARRGRRARVLVWCRRGLCG